MNILTTAEYAKEKISFLHRHNDWKVETSPMDEYGTYHKTYTCEDGAVWNEVIRPIWDSIYTEVRKVKVNIGIKLLETEGWNTDNAQSIYCYEKF